MSVTRMYKCLCDDLRLRILNLLQQGPLCVCHLVEILDCDQVKMSKQLRYMKELGIVAGERQAQWIIYRLVVPDDPLLVANLGCLREEAGDELPFEDDLAKYRKLISQLQSAPSGCSETLLAERKAGRA